MKKRLAVLLALMLSMSMSIPMPAGADELIEVSANDIAGEEVIGISDNAVEEEGTETTAGAESDNDIIAEEVSDITELADEDSEISDTIYTYEDGNELSTADTEAELSRLIQSVQFKTSGNNAYIKEYWGVVSKYIMPETITLGVTERKNYKIVGICEYAFKDANALETVSMSNIIEDAGENCFIGATSLNKINISEKLSYIPEGCFLYCENLKKIYIPKTVKSISKNAFSSSCNIIHDVYYGGSESDWKDIDIQEHNEMLEGARFHYNSSFGDYYKDNNFSNPPEKYVEKDDYWIKYNSVITFPGRKIKAKDFGDITISYNGQEYTASKIKINKKKQLFQITNIGPKDKSLRKHLKKSTKGDKGLTYTIMPYEVSTYDTVKVKLDKNNNLKSVKIKFENKYYKCKKTEYDYYPEINGISFKGDNLTGYYIIK